MRLSPPRFAISFLPTTRSPQLWKPRSPNSTPICLPNRTTPDEGRDSISNLADVSSGAKRSISVFRTSVRDRDARPCPARREAGQFYVQSMWTDSMESK